MNWVVCLSWGSACRVHTRFIARSAGVSTGWKTLAQYCINKVMSCMVACLQLAGLPDCGMLRRGMPLHVRLDT